MHLGSSWGVKPYLCGGKGSGQMSSAEEPLQFLLGHTHNMMCTDPHFLPERNLRKCLPALGQRYTNRRLSVK